MPRIRVCIVVDSIVSDGAAICLSSGNLTLLATRGAESARGRIERILEEFCCEETPVKVFSATVIGPNEQT